MTTRIIFCFFIVSTFCVFLAWTDENDEAHQNKIATSEQSKELAKLVLSTDFEKIKAYLSKQVSDVKHQATLEVTKQVSDAISKDHYSLSQHFASVATKQVSDVKHQATLEVTKQVSELLCKHVQHNFITYVECAFHTWKPVLEIVFKLNSPEQTLLDSIHIPSMPEDIVNLNTNCDKWMYNYDSSPFLVPLKITTTIESKDCRSNLETYYKKWYYFLTEDESDFANLLKEELSNHAKHYQDFYKGQNITVRFAACIARSYILCCTMHYRVLPDLHIYLMAHPKADFVKRLFEVIPSWYLDEETLLYLNILRSVKYEIFKHKSNNGDILCLPARNPENKMICIPYLRSDECRNVDFAKHSTLKSRLIRLTPLNLE